ncbi:MAG: hypothetical protein J6N15_04780 [Ruminiclostridium sp.]|nr:hypothetical protein [Ruminiclostridium sp.]
MMGDSTTSGKDTISNWVESTGDTDKGNTISLKGGMSSLILGTVANGSAQVAQDTTSGATFSAGSTITSSDATTGSNKLGVNVITDDGTYSALLFGKAGLTSQQGIKFDNYNYLIADKDQTLNLGTTSKTTVVLANRVDEKHWGDTGVYQNVVTVTSSKKGKSLIINGKENDSMTANLSGSNDSVWGANNLVGDEITLTKEKSQVVFTGANDGLDSITNYDFGSSASKANAVRFLDGVNYISAGNQTLTFGADESNAVVVKFAAATADSIAYGFGTEGDKYVAGVDATADGKGTIAYGSDVNVYIGQGDNSYISVDSAAKNVKLGWDGGAGYVSIGGIDATLASDGAVVIGTTDNAQSIAGSSRGASSISGGFVADEWTDTNADTLYGGGVATKTTTFFVGDKMGKDEIQNLSSKDNIVFLGTKYEDLVKFAPETTDSEFTFKFANGNVIEASAGSKKLANIKDVSLYFDDGTYIWNGSTLEKAE